MESLLVRLSIIMSVVDLGMKLGDFRDCHSRACLVRIERRARDVLRVDWKPISVFPDEAIRFRPVGDRTNPRYLKLKYWATN
jgi:hypothetical protein